MGIVGMTRVMAVKTKMGPLDYRGSASEAFTYQNATGATSFICVGMAFGINDNYQSYGDVLVSTGIFPYDARDVISENGNPKYKYPRAKYRRSKRALIALFERHANSSAPSFRVHFGALLSGSAIIRCRAYRDMLIDAFFDRGHTIVGGEMEGVGILSISPPDTPNWIVVKGICDFADENRDSIIESTRPDACKNAAFLVLRSIQAAGQRLI